MVVEEKRTWRLGELRKITWELRSEVRAGLIDMFGNGFLWFMN
tara:strand:+ start:233 stop:361 length:129 start_codon:yes stop_codon:yes gene_type:complete